MKGKQPMNQQQHPSDAEIVELYFARDEEAICKTADKYGGYCKSISMSLLHSEPDAEPTALNGRRPAATSAHSPASE